VSELEAKELADTLFSVTRRVRWHVNERMREAGLSFARLRTVEGKRQLVTASKVRSEVIAELFGALSAHDRTQLDRILGALRDAVPDPPDGWKKAAPVRGMAP
jgi:hypothetical protein